MGIGRKLVARVPTAGLLVVTLIVLGAAVAAAATFGGAAPNPQITCSSHTFGDASSCQVIDGDGLEVLWPDGTRTPITSDGTVRAHVDTAGAASVLVVDGQDVLATASIDIAPDLAVHCDDGPVDTVYEIVPWADGEHGWGYAYVDPDTGREIRPGDADYPADPGLTSLHLVEVDRVTTTGRCEVVSTALDRFDGSVWFEFAAPFEEPLRLPLRTPVPFSRSHWVGTQPAQMTVTISVGGIDASERRGVYASGCT